MPELPDLTVFAENLSALYVGKEITAVHVLKSKTIAPVEGSVFIRSLTGRKVTEIHRRGKQLVFSLDDGNALWVHLMLHGEMYHMTEGEPPHVCITVQFSDGRYLAFSDRTQWMHVAVCVKNEVPPWASRGADPLSEAFTPEYLSRVLVQKPKTEIKPLLMDQQQIGGIGNAFVDEIL